MRLAATSKFTPVSLSKITAIIIPKLTAAMNESVALVQEEAQSLAPVRTGALKAGIITETTWSGNTVEGEVISTVPYSSFVEWGVGARGAEGPDAGPFPYTTSIKGFAAIPFMRPALDQSRSRILGIFEEHLKT